MTTPAKRLAAAQVVLRDANERVKGRAPDARPQDRLIFVCECSDLHCTAVLKLSLREYEQVRRHPDRFLIAVAHESAEREVVVSENTRFAVVQKVGAGKTVSRENDPRSRSASERRRRNPTEHYDMRLRGWVQLSSAPAPSAPRSGWSWN